MISAATVGKCLRLAVAAVALTIAAGTLAAPVARAGGLLPSHVQLPKSAPSGQPGHISELCVPPDFYCFWDLCRHEWCILRVDYCRYDPYTCARIIEVKLFCYNPYNCSWYYSVGSGSEKNGYLTFALNRANDGLGMLFFEGKINSWGTYHQVGDCCDIGWFYLDKCCIY